MFVDDLEFSEMPVFKTDFLRSKAGGIRVVLHDHGTMPDLKQGFSISPGTEAEASIIFASSKPIRNLIISFQLIHFKQPKLYSNGNQ